MAKLLSGTKNLVSKTVSRGHKTDDQDYKALETAFNAQHKTLQALNADIGKFMSSVEDWINREKAIATNLKIVAKDGTEFARMLQAEQDLSQRLLDERKTNLELEVKAKFLDPLTHYLNQYREIQDRIRERNNRESEVRKHESNVEKFQKKDDVKLNHEQARLESCAESFDDLNTELKNDIPTLITDTDLFMASIYGQYFSVRTQFFSTVTNYHKDVLNTFSLTTHPTRTVIVAREHSSVSKAYTVGSSASPRTTQPAHQPAAVHQPAQAQQPALPPTPPRPALPGKQAKAMWDYTAQNPQELSIRAGEVLTILDNSSEWWRAEVNGRSGFVPGNFLQLI